MGRPRKWTPRPATRQDFMAGALIRGLYGPDEKLETRIRNDYKEFCRLSRLSADEGLEPFVGQMKNDGLDPGTIRNYALIACHGNRSRVAYAMRKSVEAFHSHAGGRGHAVDQSTKVLTDYVRWAEKDGEPLAKVLWILLVTGQRPIDIHRIEERDLWRERGFLKVVARWTKGIRKIKHRRQVDYPLKNLMPPPKSLKLGARIPKRKRQVYLYVNTSNQINAVMRDVAKRHKLVKATTGSFRRDFSERIKPHCKRLNISVKDMMLHRSEDMDAAHYAFDRKKGGK